MTRRLPSTHGLQAFEAAARLGSFRRAARLLGISQAALSQRIQALESLLGVRLFDRFGDGARVTATGADYLAEVMPLLARLTAATRRLTRASGARRELRLSILPSLAQRWLVPRLPALRAALPDIDLVLDISDELADLVRDEADLAVRFGTGRYPGLACQYLMDEKLIPVCAPQLASGLAGAKAQDLRDVPLLHDDVRQLYPEGRRLWDDWFRMAGCAGEPGRSGLVFSDAGVMVEAALAGAGIALARHSLVADELAAGRLHTPIRRALPSPHATYVVSLPRRSREPAIAAASAWLQRAASQLVRRDPNGSV